MKMIVKPKKVYLSKLDGNILSNVDKEAVSNLQAIIKTLLSEEKNKKELNKLHYKKLQDSTLREGIGERGAITISLTDEQYQNLLKEPVVEKKKSNVFLYLAVLLVVVAIAVVGYIYLNGRKKADDKPQNYTITFVTNSEDQMGAVNVENGSTVDLSKLVPSRDNYTFAGWYTDSRLTDLVEGIYMPKGNTTLYAGWKEIVNCKECEVGKTITLIDNSPWIVIDNKENNPNITLLDPICFGSFVFDTSEACSQGNCSNNYQTSTIKEYLENDYLTSLSTLKPLIKEVRLIKVEEIKPLLEMENADEWLFNKNVWDTNWWTMTPVGESQYYSITVDGKIEPSNQDDTETGTADNFYGVRPVIVIDKSAINQNIEQ